MAMCYHTLCWSAEGHPATNKKRLMCLLVGDSRPLAKLVTVLSLRHRLIHTAIQIIPQHFSSLRPCVTSPIYPHPPHSRSTRRPSSVVLLQCHRPVPAANHSAHPLKTFRDSLRR